MIKTNNTYISKKDIKGIIDGLYLQSVWICLCIDELNAIREIGNENIKKYKVQNFMYITHSSLIYRFSMELEKLLNKKESMSIYHICNVCSNNPNYFGNLEIKTVCKNLKDSLKNYQSLTEILIGRRNKTYAHNDKEYYLFTQKAIDDFPLHFEDIVMVSDLIYEFAKKLKANLSPTEMIHYPTPSDDVKRLFGMKTDCDIYLESID